MNLNIKLKYASIGFSFKVDDYRYAGEHFLAFEVGNFSEFIKIKARNL
jgi:hypothetical protein